jgi:hypothetical protein
MGRADHLQTARRRRLQHFFVAAGTCLLNRCLATIAGYSYRDGFMKHVAEGVLSWHDVHTKFYKDWFRHSEVDEGDTQTAV